MAVNLPRKLHFIGAVKDEWQLYSDRSTDYTIGSPIGFGASSVVYAAVYNPPPPEPQYPTPCALKVLDLDALPPHSLSLLQRETQLMSLSKHPNVLRVRGSWIDGHKLYIAVRLMNKGSAADVMHYGWPGGMEEEVVKCILKQALEGLNYLHINGFIHRDIKAANLLIDDDGTVLLGDLGVAASLTDDGDILRKANGFGNRIVNFDLGPVPAAKSSSTALPHTRPSMGKRGSFVGTPCWMAPELIQGHRYDSKADIWSFAITAIELTQGRPPRSRESAHTVLLQTVQGKPPTLDRVGGLHQYSRAFKDVVDNCLVKDPSTRLTAAQLLQTPFFKSAKKKSYLVSTILDGLPPLTMRQERRRRQPSMVSHGTMDSWDFSVTETNPCAPSTHSVSRSGSFNIGSDNRHESVHPDIHPRFELPNRANDINEQPTSIVRPIKVIVSPTSYSTSASFQSTGPEKDHHHHLPSSPPLPPLLSFSESSDSAQSRAGYGVLSHLDSSFPEPPLVCKPGSLGMPQFAPRSVPAPIPIPRSKTYSRKSPFSSPADGVDSAATSGISPGLWQRLTGTTSRNAIDEESPVREKKKSGLSRILSRRHSTSLS
ncbi:kinase-like protein [Rhizopogon vinicolor AM-OR11-026]|uniref:Kinase-like protein n=1 Tax=Rhizopogon vinicolor AM-OR11-026 TaxID=1314800 RepID=A0A1B7NJ03_9AGAM|nr:kinase-like protein [Rhizopogon vinicolor AM-OR11-026]